MRVPPHAQVWFSGEQTRQQGMHRQFVTPALDTGKTFFYQIRAKWDENGQTIDRTRKVLVHAGDRTSIDFAPHMTVVSEMTPAQPRQAERIRTGTPSERRFYEEENQGNLNQNQQPPANVNIYNNQNQTPPANNTGTAPANTNTGTKPPATGTNNRPPQP